MRRPARPAGHDPGWRARLENSLPGWSTIKRPHAQLLGKVLWDEFAALKGQIGYCEFHRAVRENRTVVFEEYYAPYQTLSEVRAYPSDEGLTVYFRDVTEARKTEESLRISEERFRIIARATTDIVWDWNLEDDIIALGRSLGLRVLAEGVETVAQRDFLFEHGCDACQGYLCAQALPADAAVSVVCKP